MPIQKTTKIPLRGDLRIISRDAQSLDIRSVWEKKNVITYKGTDSLVKLHAPNAALGANVQLENQIKSMRFGLSSTTPQRTDLNLLSEASVSGNYVRVQLLDANRVIGVSGTVEYVATLASGYGNGVTYREAGLFTRGTTDDPLTTSADIMFSRQVFPDHPKNSSVVLEFRWRITYTV